ncbi:hypothetical protein JZ751_024155 [Albula glossodonta]|uniref:DUF4097 domain-containing protein n=1 Tax=Albula glossodonta TaxID=121402 RepID=A0A8T2NGL9_9TELE|nr:hypothetical protein JZ751_024155 [Albula glossodonta]
MPLAEVKETFISSDAHLEQCFRVLFGFSHFAIMIFSCTVLITKRLCRGLSREVAYLRSLSGCKRTSPDAWSSHILRTISTSPGFHSSSDHHKPLKQWTLVVHPFSTVRVQLRCNISVQPLDPHTFPEANRAFITVHGTSADQGLKLDNFHVQYDDQNKELIILSERVNSNVSVELTAPIKSDLHITTQGEGNVKIQKMECDICRVLTERGHCVLQSVKMVNIKKIQGTSMNVSTEHGPLKVKAIYAESTSVSSISGKIELGHLHDGSNGHLNVSSMEGDIDVYVGQNGTAELHSKQGTISVRVPSSMTTGVSLTGASVEISPEITLQQVEQETTDTKTTVTGELLNTALLRTADKEP